MANKKDNGELRCSFCNKTQSQVRKLIAGPGDLHIEHDLLSDQYKAVLPLVGYYQFMDKYFTPKYLLDIIAAREQNS